MTRRPPPDLPEHKPVSEMTPEEQREFARELGKTIRRELAELNRPKRERRLRKGLVRPRNQAMKDGSRGWIRASGSTGRR